MPRILVADDNSNIHRAISLALKDSGVEVVAVGNGDAAVRKMPEIKPNVVLADIFMPVRNGYEVCEFVKNDPRFSETPVVLLIGAFDPFDEREAQRVKADAILKKPFVPPDALVRTVTELIAKSAPKSAANSAHTASNHAEEPVRTNEAASDSAESAPEYSDAAPEEFSTPRASLAFSPNDQTLAFGSLLEETPALTEETAVTAQRDPNLGEPVFWSASESKDQLVEDAEDAKTVEEKADEPAIADQEDSEQWELSKLLEPFPAESQGMPATLSTPSESAELPELPSFSLPVGNVVPPEEPRVLYALAAPENALPELPSGETLPPLPAAENLPALPQAEFEPEEPVLAAVAADKIGRDEEILTQLKDSWLPNAAAPEPTVIKQVSPEAHVEEAAPFANLAPFLATLAHSSDSESSPSSSEQTEAAADSQSEMSEHASSEISEHASALTPSPLESVILQAVPSAALQPATHGSADSAVLEALVQRVIEKMQPQMLDLVTRELLRPVVESLVQKELEKK